MTLSSRYELPPSDAMDINLWRIGVDVGSIEGLVGTEPGPPLIASRSELFRFSVEGAGLFTATGVAVGPRVGLAERAVAQHCQHARLPPSLPLLHESQKMFPQNRQ